jgi:hypothetical protein
MSTRQQRQELAACAPDFPAELPPRVRGKPLPLTKIVEPFVEKRIKEDEDFRAAAASVNAENSPNERVCFDDRDMAAAIKEDGRQARIQRIIDVGMGPLSTAVKRVLSLHGLGRAKRIREAKQALLLGSAQPAE